MPQIDVTPHAADNLPSGTLRRLGAMTILVTDGNERAALAIARGLGKVGHRVHVGAVGGSSIAGASRYSRGEFGVADPLTSPHAFVRDLLAERDRTAADVIIPVSEGALLAVLAERSEFGSTIIPFPNLETFRAISDKAALMASAKRLGIAVPNGETAHSALDARRIARDLGFPVVLKPSRSVATHAGRRVKLGVVYADDAAQLDARLATLDPAAFPLLVQQRVAGAGVGVFLLLWDGEVRAVFAHRRLREKPPSGGVSVYCESVAANPELVAQSVSLLRDAGWTGVAMVEYKHDDRTGRPVLMEINGRFWGSLQLAVDAGVNFPALLLAAAVGSPCSPQTHYRIGLRNRWWWGDVDHLLIRLRRTAAALQLPSDAPSRSGALMEFLRAAVSGVAASSLDDPRPFLRESRQWLGRR